MQYHETPEANKRYLMDMIVKLKISIKWNLKKE
jgi:hypothetical protein